MTTASALRSRPEPIIRERPPLDGRMRIRSIKPEFWRSDDITQLDFFERLLFIGLWSYVDDNGVGLDDERAIVADLFAFEDDPREMRARVRDGLANLSRALVITRYGDAKRSYIHVSNWSKHQKIDRPSKARFPLPDEVPTSEKTKARKDSRDGVASPRRARSDPSMPEQRNRGTEEQEPDPLRGSAATSAATADATEVTRAQTLTKVYAEAVPLSNFAAVMGIVRKAIRSGRYSDGAIEAALLRLAADGRPVTVDTLRTELDGLPAPRSRQSTTDQRVAEAQSLKERMRAKRTNPKAIDG